MAIVRKLHGEDWKDNLDDVHEGAEGGITHAVTGGERSEPSELAALLARS